MDGLDSAQVIQISRILVIGDVLREGGLDRELSSWLVEVLRKVGSQNNVGDGSLADKILSKTCSLVGLKHHLPDLWKLFLFFICNSDEIHGLSTEMVKSSKVDILKSCKYEITELFSSLIITIIDELHQQQIIKEKLSFWVYHDVV